ncbi:MAG: minor capsid protein [Chloroflexi bacterium]|nr:minor capsid protein [Chloroflexota bacterium]
MRKALITGVATGQNPRVIAGWIHQALGGNLVRALRISRTEALRSYRESSRRAYQANDDVVAGWIWHAALDRRTCAFCWSQHGTLHKPGEIMATHPNCRCGTVPKTKTWEELGFKNVPETSVQVEKGTDLFERLSDERKREILGPAKFAAYKDGKLKLEDVAGFARHKEWGPVGYERSLRDILGEREARKWTAEAAKAKKMQEEPNKLIRSLLNPKRTLTDDEWKSVIEHVKRAPFASREVSVHKDIRGRTFLGRQLRGKEPSVIAHFAKRVLLENQWVDGTSEDQYLADLRSILDDHELSKVVYQGTDEKVYLGFLAPNRLPVERTGMNRRPFIWFIYSADYGTITSGYQVSSIDKITLPKGVKWR